MNTSLLLLGVALSVAGACGGSEFTPPTAGFGGSGGDGEHAAGAGSAGEAESGLGGASGELGGASGELGGASGELGGVGQGGNETGGAGHVGSGAPLTPSDCEALSGAWFEEHCYVDVTIDSVHQVDATAACDALAERAGRPGELLSLDSPAEQAFVIEQFLNETSDAWLGLTCNSKKYADLSDCYCQSCEDGQLLEKRAAWTWPDGSSSSFGWSGQNPDGAGRCSALAFNNANDRWGWVDRVCLNTSHKIDSYPVHSYRAICELSAAVP